jgi:hypothetical protein
MSVIAAPRQRLKTGAELRKQQQHHRRAEFFALPIMVSVTPFRRIAVSPYRRIAVSPYRRVAVSPCRPFAVSLLNPGSDYSVRILGKFVYLSQGQPEVICR